MNKTYDIYHYTYENVCLDDYFGKDSKTESLGYVSCTEQDVKAIVDALNEMNHSYYASEPDPDFLYDKSYLDEDYYAYEEVVAQSFKDFTESVRVRGNHISVTPDC